VLAGCLSPDSTRQTVAERLEAQACGWEGAAMKTNCWMTELHALAARFTGYGFNADLATITMADAWGLYLFLMRLAGAD
jgi:hypothetical protein